MYYSHSRHFRSLVLILHNKPFNVATSFEQDPERTNKTTASLNL